MLSGTSKQLSWYYSSLNPLTSEAPQVNFILHVGLRKVEEGVVCFYWSDKLNFTGIQVAYL